MAAFTRTYTVTGLSASGPDNVAVSLAEDTAAASPTPGMGGPLVITMPNADAAQFEVHGGVSLSLTLVPASA